MRKPLSHYLLFSLCFLLFGFNTTSIVFPKERIIKNFTLKNVDNTKISLDSYTDAKGFIIVFTCNKCPMAKLYSDRMNKIAEKYKKQKVYLLALNAMDTLAYAEESFKLMQKKAKKDNFNFPYLQDKKQTVAKEFGATHTPQSFVIWKNKKNKWQIRYEGAIDTNAGEPSKAKPQLTVAVEELLQGKEVSTAKTESFGCKIYYRGIKNKMD
ncbi:thioredoxin family protein [Flavobacterium sp. SUN046]|uniref:thioredoxin family protein n=1 Tax=Flavobacterium sp. SUN046 TaxID=3002440 RepID=UPI002DB937DD|nr:thioredoxin family protein [Flavobacterium sp. SUN046]MEC4048272.1 thioredoxin family protein [Flavobacterium sp. SUN046]